MPITRRRKYAYFEILRYDLDLSIQRANLALAERELNAAREHRMEARRGYETASEALRVAQMPAEEIAALREKLKELKELLEARRRRS